MLLIQAFGCTRTSGPPVTPVPPGESEYRFDTSKLTAPPPDRLPSPLLTRSAFEEANITQAFAEKLPSTSKPMQLGPSRIVVLSDEWRIERDPIEGSLLVARRQPGEIEREPEEGEPGRVTDATPPQYRPRENKLDEAKAKSMALERLTRFGVPAGEIGQIASLELVSQDLDGDSLRPGDVELISYKTLVYRAINGVPVQGHRAVVTYWPDGSLKRTLAHWPAIASRGNQLSTKLSVAEITGRATSVLAREGVARGSRASLRWKYVPVKQENGEVTLRLVAAARVPVQEELAAGAFAEPREFEVPVDSQ